LGPYPAKGGFAAVVEIERAEDLQEKPITD
jgi:hypothetical protein